MTSGIGAPRGGGDEYLRMQKQQEEQIKSDKQLALQLQYDLNGLYVFQPVVLQPQDLQDKFDPQKEIVHELEKRSLLQKLQESLDSITQQLEELREMDDDESDYSKETKEIEKLLDDNNLDTKSGSFEINDRIANLIGSSPDAILKPQLDFTKKEIELLSEIEGGLYHELVYVTGEQYLLSTKDVKLSDKTNKAIQKHFNTEITFQNVDELMKFFLKDYFIIYRKDRNLSYKSGLMLVPNPIDYKYTNFSFNLKSTKLNTWYFIMACDATGNFCIYFKRINDKDKNISIKIFNKPNWKCIFKSKDLGNNMYRIIVIPFQSLQSQTTLHQQISDPLYQGYQDQGYQEGGMIFDVKPCRVQITKPDALENYMRGLVNNIDKTIEKVL